MALTKRISIRDGSILCLKIGRTVLVPDNLLDRMMAEAGIKDA
jgi:hypothetical protein